MKALFITNDRNPKHTSMSIISDNILEIRSNSQQLDCKDNIDVENLMLSSISRKRNHMAMLLSQSDQALKRRSTININPRGNEHNIKLIYEKNDALLRYDSNSYKREDSIIKSTVIEGYHNLENGSDNNSTSKYNDSSDVLPSNKLLEYIKIMIMLKSKIKNNSLNNYIISDSAYEAIAVVIEELVKEIFFSWRNSNNNVPIQNVNEQLKAIVISQLQGFDTTTDNDQMMQTIMNRILVLTGNNTNKNDITQEIKNHLFGNI